MRLKLTVGAVAAVAAAARHSERDGEPRHPPGTVAMSGVGAEEVSTRGIMSWMGLEARGPSFDVLMAARRREVGGSAAVAAKDHVTGITAAAAQVEKRPRSNDYDSSESDANDEDWVPTQVTRKGGWRSKATLAKVEEKRQLAKRKPPAHRQVVTRPGNVVKYVSLPGSDHQFLIISKKGPEVTYFDLFEACVKTCSIDDGARVGPLHVPSKYVVLSGSVGELTYEYYVEPGSYTFELNTLFTGGARLPMAKWRQIDDPGLSLSCWCSALPEGEEEDDLEEVVDKNGKCLFRDDTVTRDMKRAESGLLYSCGHFWARDSLFRTLKDSPGTKVPLAQCSGCPEFDGYGGRASEEQVTKFLQKQDCSCSPSKEFDELLEGVQGSSMDRTFGRRIKCRCPENNTFFVSSMRILFGRFVVPCHGGCFYCPLSGEVVSGKGNRSSWSLTPRQEAALFTLWKPPTFGGRYEAFIFYSNLFKEGNEKDIEGFGNFVNRYVLNTQCPCGMILSHSAEIVEDGKDEEESACNHLECSVCNRHICAMCNCNIGFQGDQQMFTDKQLLGTGLFLDGISTVPIDDHYNSEEATCVQFSETLDQRTNKSMYALATMYGRLELAGMSVEAKERRKKKLQNHHITLAYKAVRLLDVLHRLKSNDFLLGRNTYKAMESVFPEYPVLPLVVATALEQTKREHREDIPEVSLDKLTRLTINNKGKPKLFIRLSEEYLQQGKDNIQYTKGLEALRPPPERPAFSATSPARDAHYAVPAAHEVPEAAVVVPAHEPEAAAEEDNQPLAFVNEPGLPDVAPGEYDTDEMDPEIERAIHENLLDNTTGVEVAVAAAAAAEAVEVEE